MTESSNDGVDDKDNRAEHHDDGPGDSEELDQATSTTLVEVTPGVAVVFGDVPEGLDLVSLDLVPSFDRAKLSTALGSLGNTGTIAGNLGEAISSAQGLFRVDSATLKLLNEGGQMAVKDGAKLGAIFKDGKLVAQARFLPASMTAASALAAIGPAVAMIALQMQLGEISRLAQSNIALTTQTLRVIRNEQWAELEGLTESVHTAIQEARDLDAITDSVWEPVASSGRDINKHLKLYQKNVSAHIKELGRLTGRQRREYLETNAEAIVFDTYALLNSLNADAEYQVLRAGLARSRSAGDENEARLFELITDTAPKKIEESLTAIKSLTEALVRELRIISELPGRATVPLTKKRRDSKASQLTCSQLLESIEPLADMLQPPTEMPSVPETVCAPESIALDPYLKVIRWFLEGDEQLRCVAFPYVVGKHNLTGMVPAVLARRVDATWDALDPNAVGRMVEKVAPSSFVAVTDRRIITADPQRLLRRGMLESTYALDDVKYVRSLANQGDRVRPTIGVTTEQHDVQWMFPEEADTEAIDALAEAIMASVSSSAEPPAAIEPTPDEASSDDL